MHKKIILECIIIALCVGCTDVKSIPQKRAKLGTHHIRIVPCKAKLHTFGTEEDFEGDYECTAGNVKIIIKDEELIVNDKPFGKLSPGDSILIDHGSVEVNHEPLGRVYLPKEREETTPTILDEVAGYAIRINPGIREGYSKSTFNEVSILAFRKNDTSTEMSEIIIKNDNLYLDGKSYGTLNKGDEIDIIEGRVLISGKERVP